MNGHQLDNERGSILLFTTVTLALLLIFGGLAIDLTYFGSVRRELQRSMDAAALAGAGNLGFDDTAFPSARDAAQRYAGLNGYSDSPAGTVGLNLNTANDPNGDIILGIWDGTNFDPSLDGTRVNAVRCRLSTPVQISTSFLRLLGITSLSVAAQATAVANPPQNPDTCVFPVALSDCPFAGASSSQGCGSRVTLIDSSGDPDHTNYAAWANPCGTSQPTPGIVTKAINDAASGTCACPGGVSGVGQSIPANNGMMQPAFNELKATFVAKFKASGTYEVKDSNNNSVYTGPGWKVFVPVIHTDCPPQAINQPLIVGWTELVITQVYDGTGNDKGCAVSNPDDTISLPICGGPIDHSLREVFGFFNCTYVHSVPTRDPGPRSALGTRLRLVQ